MAKPLKTAISPTREQNYPEWYQQVIKAADLAEPSVVRGCMVIKPRGYALWENIQRYLDKMFKDTGHVNAYFPLFIPLSYLEKEAEHVEGFAKECAVVTHHRLVEKEDGSGLIPASPLEEPLVVRPTSETIIGETYSKWVQSYRDLPILINQWANIVRWEMRTRLFLRTTEFLWQEGHTVHASKQEAIDETLKMLNVYSEFAEEYMAMPVIKGEKTKEERFPGAVNTYSIEAMMQDGKALQSGTSHFLGQNFARASQIKFLNQNEKEVYAWTTSWGVSTRLIGGLIMTHSDDDGLIIPPRLAPVHIVIIPIYKSDTDKSRVMDYCVSLQKELKSKTYEGYPINIEIDNRDYTGSERSWLNIKSGTPIRLEIGPRDIDSNSVFMGRRDLPPKEKKSISKEEFIQNAPTILADIQKSLYNKAVDFRDKHTKHINTLKDFKDFFQTPDNMPSSGFAWAHAADSPKVTEILTPLKVTARCMPMEKGDVPGTCIFTGEKVDRKTVFAKSY